MLGACSGAPESQENGVEAVVVRENGGQWENLPVGTRVRIDGTLAGAFENGARVDIAPTLCAHLAMSRQEWDRLMMAAGPGRRVTVYGSKTADPGGSNCRLHLDRVGFIAR